MQRVSFGGSGYPLGVPPNLPNTYARGRLMNHRSAYATFGYWCLLLLAGCASTPATPTREARAPASTGTLAPVTSTLTPPAPSDTAIAQRGTSPTPSQEAATPMPAPTSAA